MDSRKDRLAAQKVQVALVFQKMLGTDAARAYLIENNFAESNIDRILYGDIARKRAAPVETQSSVNVRSKVETPCSAMPPIEQQWRERRRRIANKM